ncbi:hypothetical protein C1H76_8861 [Elsinoe australis]|uniref:Uncharacterized protein n=1 Tax=Elsinoe australis TaxID=40998 RepID=A0A4V6DTC7_9PEZI|nr:hypothetical protein C1H76_8861 [Elsinoe australis]
MSWSNTHCGAGQGSANPPRPARKRAKITMDDSFNTRLGRTENGTDLNKVDNISFPITIFTPQSGDLPTHTPFEEHCDLFQGPGAVDAETLRSKLEIAVTRQKVLFRSLQDILGDRSLEDVSLLELEQLQLERRRMVGAEIALGSGTASPVKATPSQKPLSAVSDSRCSQQGIQTKI